MLVRSNVGIMKLGEAGPIDNINPTARHRKDYYIPDDYIRHMRETFVDYHFRRAPRYVESVLIDVRPGPAVLG